jgi:hypothetical protein
MIAVYMFGLNYTGDPIRQTRGQKDLKSEQNYCSHSEFIFDVEKQKKCTCYF